MKALLGFVIQTDHESLKHMLDQKIHTFIQKKGLTKLLGLNYQIIYRRGKENKAANALSRRDTCGIGKLQEDKLEGGGFTTITKII
jgi:hypothetical protein